jgi:hypothetical protein
MDDQKKSPRPSQRKKKTLRSAAKAKSKTDGHLPPNQSLQKFPDETFGDMQLPFPRP